MREIKFRIWDKKSNLMIPWRCLFSNFVAGRDRAKGSAQISWDVIFSSPDFELMQFAGLADHNGIEIYEGDIIKEYGLNAKNEPGIIKYSLDADGYFYHCGFMVEWMEGFKRRSDLSFWVRERTIKVIGNIYEDRGLLEDKEFPCKKKYSGIY